VGTRAAIYCRISNDRDGTGLGVQRQETACVALCDARGWQVTSTLVDNDVSAYSGRRRPAYEQLLTLVDTGDIDAIVAWDPDRLHRSPRELERFIDLIEERRVAVATVQGGEYDLTTAAGRMTARVVGAVARHESEHKSERQRAKAAELARLGLVAGGGSRPYGFLDDRLTIDPAEAAVIRDAARRVLAGESVRGIVADLDQRGVPTVSGRPWTPHVLRRILIAPRTAGLRSHRGRVVADAAWPAIVTRADHERLVHVLTDPGRRVNAGARRYLLTGLATCTLCGGRLVARPRTDRRRCYVCSSGPGFGGCGRIRVLADPLEELVAARVFDVVGHLDLSAGRGVDEDLVLAEITAVEGKLDQLATDWADGNLDRRSWLTARARLDARLEELRRQLVAGDDRSSIEAWAGDHGALEAAWSSLRIDQQRAVVAAVVDRVTVGPAVRGRNRFDPNRVTIDWR
jgi:site-specific DNA recombinase